MPDLVRVSERFHLKPLLPILNQVDRFYLMTMSQHCLRHFDCTPGHCQLVSLPAGMPDNIEQANRFEDTAGAGRNQMTDRRQDRAKGSAGASGSSHGLGATNEELEEFRLRFLRQLNQGLTSFLCSQSVPLMLAGVDNLVHAFRKELTYPSVLSEHLSGNLLDLAAMETLRKGGQVLALDSAAIPDPASPVSAIFRY